MMWNVIEKEKQFNKYKYNGFWIKTKVFFHFFKQEKNKFLIVGTEGPY